MSGDSSSSGGGARKGARHWLAQRLTGAALVPLTLWFVVSALSLTGADYGAFQAWLGGFGNAALMILLIIAMFYHAELGVREVVEDYVHAATVKTAALVLTRIAAFGFGAAAVFAVIKMVIQVRI
ncbi:MAG: succinate dehydrogenase, hydrophobic membrane anchor protein [Rhodospirillales bacterium]